LGDIPEHWRTATCSTSLTSPRAPVGEVRSFGEGIAQARDDPRGAESASARPPRRCLRPETVIELAAEVGYRELPTGDPGELGRWFTRGADRKSLELYLEGFQHTIALLQTRDAIERVAAECAEDLAADNVVYAEVRYARSPIANRGWARRPAS